MVAWVPGMKKREKSVVMRACEKHPLLAGGVKQDHHDRKKAQPCTEDELAASSHAALRVTLEYPRFC